MIGPSRGDDNNKGAQKRSSEKFEPGMLCCARLIHPGRDSCVRSLLPAVPHPMSEALSPLQPRHCPPAGSVPTACCSLVFRLCFACIPLVFPWVCPAPPPPHSHPAFRTARTTTLQYRDAAAPEMVTALLRRESPLQPSKGLQFKSLPAQAQTYRMNQKATREKRCSTSQAFSGYGQDQAKGKRSR
jgi:hypothetical protein